MKCKVFHVPMPVTRASGDVSGLNEFLEGVKVSRIFSSVVGEHTASWSVLVFYEDSTQARGPHPVEAAAPVKPDAAGQDRMEPDSGSAEDAALTPSEEAAYAALRRWRTGEAAKAGLPPFIIAPNATLRQIARSHARTATDLAGIRGLGKRRMERYGNDILRVTQESAAGY